MDRERFFVHNFVQPKWSCRVGWSKNFEETKATSKKLFQVQASHKKLSKGFARAQSEPSDSKPFETVFCLEDTAIRSGP